MTLYSYNQWAKLKYIVWLGVLLLSLAGLVGCTAVATSTDRSNATTSDNQSMDSMDTTDAEHDEAADVFVPNNGAEVKLVSPADGAVVAAGADIPITIETVNFPIGENGNHWHIYLDGTPIMVMGGNTFVLQNLSSGQHTIEVFLSLGTHENLEEGDTRTITVEE
ncbi:MAG: hypothetical protein KBE23_11650 [Chloroflexi bacterium]|nr:hypothetical protein [Chloroflexota bacterium]MBP7043389.1 hypothetical protein [Chloroflexota bacterium]